MQESAVKDFFEAWSIYETVLENNYMFHDEIYQEVQRFIKNHYSEKPFSILDLGCGSARHFASALAESSVSHYCGYDLSEIALNQARQNLADLDCPLELHQGDLLDGLKTNQGSFDLIFSSFALHHLAKEEKELFFQLAYQKLVEDGILLVIDVMREENEDRQTYFNNYCGWMKSDWKMMSVESLEAISCHIQDYDFPEKASEMKLMATNAGFKISRKINQFHWHQMWYFEK